MPVLSHLMSPYLKRGLVDRLGIPERHFCTPCCGGPPPLPCCCIGACLQLCGASPARLDRHLQGWSVTCTAGPSTPRRVQEHRPRSARRGRVAGQCCTTYTPACPAWRVQVHHQRLVEVRAVRGGHDGVLGACWWQCVWAGVRADRGACRQECWLLVLTLIQPSLMSCPPVRASRVCSPCSGLLS